MKNINSIYYPFLFLFLFSFTAHSQTLTLDINGLEDLGSNYMYEGWLIVNSSPVSTGTFSVDGSGNLSQTVFNVDLNNLINATTFVLTIEPDPDPDPSPSAVHILAGDFIDFDAPLSVGHPAALGDDFSSIDGNYILATPTNGPSTDELSGIWFLDLTSGTPAVGLTLPTLPAGWKYEGWTVISGMPVTSGKFTAVDMADESAPYSGPDPGPPFPGEDYLFNAPAGLTFPTDLSGQTGVISIEPDPDNEAAPFLLKPLVGPIPVNAIDHETYSMNSNVSNSFPTGVATRSQIVPVELTSFTAQVVDGKAVLIWETATETNNAGFGIERSSNEINFNTVGYVPGHGTTANKSVYSFTDNTANSGVYYYRLKQQDFDGSFVYSNVVEVDLSVPSEFSLQQNYPNPFNPTTVIAFSVAQETNVNLVLYDVLGNEVRTLVNEQKAPGTYNVQLNGARLSSGVYFYTLSAGGFINTKKLILMK